MRSGRLSTVVERRTKAGKPDHEAPKENANSAQARKDQKRRKRSCVRKPSRCVKRLPVWKKDGEAERATGAGGRETRRQRMYDQSRKAELTACLQQQASANPAWKSAKWRGWKPRSSLSSAAGRPKQLMAQITTTDANELAAVLNSPLCAALAIVIYKLAAAFVSSSGEIHPVLAAAGVPDGDFVDLAWSEDPAQAKHNRV